MRNAMDLYIDFGAFDLNVVGPSSNWAAVIPANARFVSLLVGCESATVTGGSTFGVKTEGVAQETFTMSSGVRLQEFTTDGTFATVSGSVGRLRESFILEVDVTGNEAGNLLCGLVARCSRNA